MGEKLKLICSFQGNLNTYSESNTREKTADESVHPTLIKGSTCSKEKTKMLKCPQCNLETKDRYNLKRHIKRIQGEEHVKAVEKGGCICLECGHKCHRIEDLRQHLADSHEFIFRFEEKQFTTVPGRTYISKLNNISKK